MNEPEYAYGVLTAHLGRAGLSGLDGLELLELGPGDSICTAQIAHAFGARASYLVDVGDYATRDAHVYEEMSEYLASRGIPAEGRDFASVLAFTRYETAGLESLRRLPTASVDVVVSQAVLEHVRRRELAALLEQLHRITKPGGCQSHVIDLRDHLGDSLQNLRFPARVWESRLFASSGFYTNRVRFGEMLALFEKAGFNADVVSRTEWERLPLRRRKLRSEFRQLDEEDLRVSTFAVVLR